MSEKTQEGKSTPSEMPLKIEEKGKTSDKPKYDKAELMKIFDEMIFSDGYEEKITIKGKLKVIFRARNAEDTLDISKDIDSKNFTLISTLQEHRALMNLTYSLTNYAGKDLRGMEIEEKVKVIKKLPAVIVGALSEELMKFDSKVAAACMEGEENF